VASARAAQQQGHPAVGLVQEAVQNLQEAIRLDPTFEPAKRLLAELQGP